jgi:predicted TIM-barrel fold metal-dependent hydrolase
VEVNARHIGVDNILWATNFPAANSTWPNTRAFAHKCLSGMSDHERKQILHGNAAKLYRVVSD